MISSRSGPYWNALLGDLSQQIKKARRKFRTNFTSQNGANVLRLNYVMYHEIQQTKNLWTDKRLSDLNEKTSGFFLKTVKRFGEPKVGVKEPMLKTNKKMSLLTPKKRNGSKKNFFRGDQSNGENVVKVSSLKLNLWSM